MKIEKNGIVQYNQPQSINNVPQMSGERSQITYIPNWTKTTISNIIVTHGSDIYPKSGSYDEY
jgi:hypothetical protein